MFTEQQLVHALQEHATLGTLNDAVIVRTCDSDYLRNTQRSECSLVGTLEFGGVINGPDANDDALTRH